MGVEHRAPIHCTSMLGDILHCRGKKGTADMAIRASGLDHKALCAYLVDGITWSRLQDIAVLGPDKGGLGLFREGSSACKQTFVPAPATIITNRPETDLLFLRRL